MQPAPQFRAAPFHQQLHRPRKGDGQGESQAGAGDSLAPEQARGDVQCLVVNQVERVGNQAQTAHHPPLQPPEYRPCRVANREIEDREQGYPLHGVAQCVPKRFVAIQE